MRVVLATDTYGDLNGVSRFIQNAADEAERQGKYLRVHTCTPMAKVGRPKRNVWNHAPRYSRPYRKYPDLEFVIPPALKMIQAMEQQRPDVIHVSTPGPVGVVGVLAAWKLGVPLAGVYHTDLPSYMEDLYGKRSMRKLAESYMRGFYKPFERVVSRSNQYMDSLREMGFDESKLRTLNPGIDIEQFHPRFKNPALWDSLGIPSASHFLYVGRISKEKNLQFLARSWQEYEAIGGEGQLVLVGEGPYQAELQQILRGYNVKFLGKRSGTELSQIYASSDGFVFPSVTDTLGQVVMEAQASGLPAIVSDQGGPQRIVQDGRTGFVRSTQNPTVWAHLLRELETDSSQRNRLGQAGHDHLQHFGFQASFEDWWRLQRDALESSVRG